MGRRAAFIGSIAALLCAAPAAAQAAVFTVTGTGDAGTCTGTTCPSLRAAIAAAEATKSEPDTINVPAGVISVTSDLLVQSEMTIVGASARTTIVDGGAKYRGFRVTTGGALTLRNFTVRNGAAGGGDITDGGGILNQGTLNLQDVRVTNSRAARGAGIANALGRITADNLLVDNNVASGVGGGGIHNTGGAEVANVQGWLFLTDATVFKNSATATGSVGGIASSGAGAVVSLSRVTLADNVGGTRGAGGLVASGNTQLIGSLVARNLVATDTVNCGTVKPTDGNFNVEDDRDCALAPGGMKPGLATALSNAGGQLDVLTIASTGDAFNRMPFGDTPCEGTDQRGMARPQSAACDAGAFELDLPPFVTINSGPSGTSPSQVEFTFQADRSGVTVQCDLVGPGQTTGYETCYKENAQPYSGLADGPYTFSVRAVNTQYPNAAATTRAFVVDTGPPNTTITGGPTGFVSSTSAAFTFTASEAGSTFQCSLDGAAFGTCPVSYTGLTQATHTFQVRAVDAAGNADPTPAARTWTVDTVAPDTTIGSGPSGATASTTAAFTYTSPEAGVAFECALDGAAFAACPVQYTGLAQGSHTFQVRARDSAGNVEATPASRTWTVDTTVPDTTITGGPTGLTASTSAAFTFTSPEAGVSFQCALDGAAFGTCPTSYTGLAQGQHTFQVRARDAAGNTDASPASRTWTVDTVAPDTTITGGPSGPTASASATFTFTATEPNSTFQCSIDGGAFSACPASYTGLTQGAHTFAVRAVDAAGNFDATPATRGWTVDTVAPALTLTGVPPARTNDTTPTFTWTAEAGATIQCRVDSGNFAGCASGYTPSVPGEGNHTAQVSAADAAGNTTIRTHSWVTDLTAPDTTITGGTASPTSDTTPEFTFASNETGSTFVCRVDDRPAAACTSPHATVALVAGSHTFQVYAVDAAGNADPTPASRTIVVDTDPPNATITSAPSGPTNDATPTFAFEAEAGATFDCTMDGARFPNCVSPFTPTALTDGAHTFAVVARDGLGNTGTAATRTFVVDTTPPASGVTGGPEGATTDPNPAFSFTASDPTVECRLDGPGGPGTYQPCASPKAFSALPPGAYTFFVRVTDAAGNRTETRRSFTVTQPQGAQPTPTPTVGPSQTPTPVPNQTIVVKPVPGGTVLVKLKGQRAFEPLDITKGIPNGSEVDVRKGRVTLTSIPKPGAPPESADFYGGIFVVTQKGGITDLRLSERLTGCPKGQQASLLQKKVKKRKLWGNGKGSFRTTGKYSAATVRGTIWLVEDTCTTTLTRVTQGVVQVNDFVRKKKTLLKQGKRYTARAKKR